MSEQLFTTESEAGNAFRADHPGALGQCFAQALSIGVNSNVPPVITMSDSYDKQTGTYTRETTMPGTEGVTAITGQSGSVDSLKQQFTISLYGSHINPDGSVANKIGESRTYDANGSAIEAGMTGNVLTDSMNVMAERIQRCNETVQSGQTPATIGAPAFDPMK